MAQRYPTCETITKAFTPDIQPLLLTDPDKAASDKAPSIWAIAELFGHDYAALIIKTQFLSLDLFNGSKRDADNDALNELATLFAHKYGGVKITEIMLFIARFKLGLYGKFYGAFDPITVGEAFRVFLRERKNEIEQLYRRREQNAIEARRFNAEAHGGRSSLEVYRELKKRAENGDKEAIELLQPPQNENI